MHPNQVLRIKCVWYDPFMLHKTPGIDKNQLDTGGCSTKSENRLNAPAPSSTPLSSLLSSPSSPSLSPSSPCHHDCHDRHDCHDCYDRHHLQDNHLHPGLAALTHSASFCSTLSRRRAFVFVTAQDDCGSSASHNLLILYWALFTFHSHATCCLFSVCANSSSSWLWEAQHAMMAKTCKTKQYPKKRSCCNSKCLVNSGVLSRHFGTHHIDSVAASLKAISPLAAGVVQSQSVEMPHCR